MGARVRGWSVGFWTACVLIGAAAGAARADQGHLLQAIRDSERDAAAKIQREILDPIFGAEASSAFVQLEFELEEGTRANERRATEAQRGKGTQESSAKPDSTEAKADAARDAQGPSAAVIHAKLSAKERSSESAREETTRTTRVSARPTRLRVAVLYRDRLLESTAEDVREALAEAYGLAPEDLELSFRQHPPVRR